VLVRHRCEVWYKMRSLDDADRVAIKAEPDQPWFCAACQGASRYSNACLLFTVRATAAARCAHVILFSQLPQPCAARRQLDKKQKKKVRGGGVRLSINIHTCRGCSAAEHGAPPLCCRRARARGINEIMITVY
jgi:hypothetical protein